MSDCSPSKGRMKWVWMILFMFIMGLNLRVWSMPWGIVLLLLYFGSLLPWLRTTSISLREIWSIGSNLIYLNLIGYLMISIGRVFGQQLATFFGPGWIKKLMTTPSSDRLGPRELSWNTLWSIGMWRCWNTREWGGLNCEQTGTHQNLDK